MLYKLRVTTRISSHTTELLATLGSRASSSQHTAMLPKVLGQEAENTKQTRKDEMDQNSDSKGTEKDKMSSVLFFGSVITAGGV